MSPCFSTRSPDGSTSPLSRVPFVDARSINDHWFMRLPLVNAAWRRLTPSTSTTI